MHHALSPTWSTRMCLCVCEVTRSRAHIHIHAPAHVLHTSRLSSCSCTPVYTSVCTREKLGTSPCSDHTRDDVTPGRRVAWITRDRGKGVGRIPTYLRLSLLPSHSLSLCAHALRDSRPLIIAAFFLFLSFSASPPPAEATSCFLFELVTSDQRKRERRGHPLDS